ncbi:MAG: aminopeptidase P family protein [Aestuariivita sp.]|nr:aminopeptidase P family protein [Aestuariivita sp.]
MYQSFTVKDIAKHVPSRLKILRKYLASIKLDGFIVPRSDVHQGEYVIERDERLSWLTGFTGSAGTAIILSQKAGLFVDGRYRAQVKSEVNQNDFEIVPFPHTTLSRWIKINTSPNSQIGFDPWLMSNIQISKIKKKLKGTDIKLTPLRRNPIDHIWHDQPKAKKTKAKIHPIEFAGESHQKKRERLALKLREIDAKAAVITLPDSIAWLLNIRGNDIPRNPVMQCFAILFDDAKIKLYVQKEKVSDITDHLGIDISILPPSSFIKTLKLFDEPILLDRDSVPYAVASACSQPIIKRDPCILPKARKNAVEISGAINAHTRDAVAMIEFLAWLDAHKHNILTEIDIVKKLEKERRKDPMLQDISFDTIAGTGANGAIVHYRVSTKTNSIIENGHLLVLDSGGQYIDGTTDVTRTIAIGDVTEEKRTSYTQVLKCMIAVSRLRWPKNLSGHDIESIGRFHLWQAHRDFDHGLGHGVGSYLNVHEGPQRLSRTSDIPLEPGMILSNEPGYYREGKYGIRIENLLVVEAALAPSDGDKHREMLCWRTLTLVPLERKLIQKDKLTSNEIKWLNEYHLEVNKKINNLVSLTAQQWLNKATAPI